MDLLNITEKEIKELSEKLHNIKKYGANKETIEDTLAFLIPHTPKKTIGIDINNEKEPTYFDLNNELVSVSPTALNNMIVESIAQLKRVFPELNEEEMFNYYILFALVHENRHVYQYLIAKEYMKAPYKIIQKAYKELIYIGDLEVGPLKNIISFYLYTKNRERLFIERNANIEATEIICNLAKYEENENIRDLFESMRQNNIIYGYDGAYNGSLEETYKSLELTSLYAKLPTGEAIPVRDRILYGLPISEETREKVLAYKY